MGYLLSDESEESDKEDSEKPGSESGSAGMFGTGLGELLSGIVFTWGVTIYAEKSCYGNGGSLVLS